MLLALATAQDLARPPVSSYRVGAVGLAAGPATSSWAGTRSSPGAGIWQTVHGEGSATLLARARGDVAVGARAARRAPVRPLPPGARGDGRGARRAGRRRRAQAGRPGRARPAARGPVPDGRSRPADLGMTGCVPGQEGWPDLALIDAVVPADALEALLRAGRRSHAPYSGAPAAVVLRLTLGDAGPWLRARERRVQPDDRTAAGRARRAARRGAPAGRRRRGMAGGRARGRRWAMRPRPGTRWQRSPPTCRSSSHTGPERAGPTAAGPRPEVPCPRSTSTPSPATTRRSCCCPATRTAPRASRPGSTAASRRSRLVTRAPRAARVHGHGRRRPGLGPDDDDGHADDVDRDGGADQPRRHDVHPRRDDWRIPARWGSATRSSP